MENLKELDLEDKYVSRTEGPNHPSDDKVRRLPPSGYLNESLIIFDRERDYSISEANQIYNSINFKINTFVTHQKVWLVLLYIRKIRYSDQLIPTELQGDVKFGSLEEILCFVEKLCHIRGYATRRSSSIKTALSFETSCLYQQLATFVSMLIAEQNWQLSIDFYHKNGEGLDRKRVLYNIVDDPRKLDLHTSTRAYKRKKGFTIIRTDEHGDITMDNLSQSLINQLALNQEEDNVKKQLNFDSDLSVNPLITSLSIGESMMKQSRVNSNMSISFANEFMKSMLPEVEAGNVSAENFAKLHSVYKSMEQDYNAKRSEKGGILNNSVNDVCNDEMSMNHSINMSKKSVQFADNHNSSLTYDPRSMMIQNGTSRLPINSSNSSPINTNQFGGNSFGFSPISNASTNHVTTVLQNVNIKDFDGNSNDNEKAKDWLRKFDYTAHMANWDNTQRIESFKVHLIGSAKHWFNRQKPSIQSNWTSIHELFKTKFCSNDITMRSKYFEMRNQPNELISDYFNRLSVAAIQAEIYFEDNEKDKLEHMRQFYNTIYDRELAKGLSMRACTTIDELEFVISTIEQTARLDKLAQNHENKKKKAQFSNSNSHESANGNNKQRNSDQSRAQVFSTNANVHDNARSKNYANQDKNSKCTHCNRVGHTKETCFKLMECVYCKRTGHPLQYCSERAKDLVSLAEQLVNDPNEKSKMPDKMKKFLEDGKEKVEVEVTEEAKDALEVNHEDKVKEGKKIEIDDETTKGEEAVDHVNFKYIYAYNGDDNVNTNLDFKNTNLSSHDFIAHSPHKPHIYTYTGQRCYELLPNQRRGWWRSNEVTHHNHDQVYVDGMINDKPEKVMLDTGANISIIQNSLAQSLNLNIIPFDAPNTFVGVSNSVMSAYGTTKIKITLADNIVYIMDVWVGNFKAPSRVILGTDFMVRAGIRIDLLHGEYILPNEVPIKVLDQCHDWKYPELDHIKNKISSNTTNNVKTVLNFKSLHYLEDEINAFQDYVQVDDNIFEPEHFQIPLPAFNDYFMYIMHIYSKGITLFYCLLSWILWMTMLIRFLCYPIEFLLMELLVMIQFEIIKARGFINQCKVKYYCYKDKMFRWVWSQLILYYFKKRPDSGIKLLCAASTSVPTIINITTSINEPTLFIPDHEHGIYTFEHLDYTKVDQSTLDDEVFIKEGRELTADQLASQLALIPELSSEPVIPINVDDADIGEVDTTSEEITRMKSIIRKYQNCFISSGNALPPPAKGVTCDIDVGDSKPIAQKARRIPPHLMEKLYELLRGLLRSGLIRFSKSSWASPIVIVLKSNGIDIRLCIDYRLVNSLTRLMLYSMPLIDDLLDNFHSTMWYISMDNASGYWAIPMTARAREVSAFICPLGQFEWLRMPQGLKNAPQLYQRIIDNALWGFVERYSSNNKDMKVVGKLFEPNDKDLWKGEHLISDVPLSDDVFNTGLITSEIVKPILFRRSYIDDINFGAKTWNELCQMFEALLESFQYWGITISLPKSAFGKHEVKFLSHRITCDGIEAAPKNLESILTMPFPKTLKGIQKFVGSLIYYHRFLDNFATYAAVLYELNDAQLRAGEGLEHAKNSFELLKQSLAKAPLLKHVDRTKPFSVIIYVNKWAFGATICQEYEGKLFPVRFVSKIFKVSEMNYFDSEKEVLALLKVFDVGFHYLAGQVITVYTRYSTLKWLFQSKSLTGRTVQWATMLSPWNLKIIRCTNVPNTLPALLAASLTPYEYFDAVLEDIAPSKITSSPTLISPFPQITREFEGYVATFDGAVRTKAPIAGAYSAILWRLPNWDIVYAASFYDLDLTVNDSEYCGLNKVLDIALEHGVNDLILCGDSRIALHQVNGSLRCHKPSLAIRMNQAQNSVKKFNNVRTAHIIRKYNAPADYIASEALKLRKGRIITDEETIKNLQQLNTLPELLYQEADQNKIASIYTAWAVEESHDEREIFTINHKNSRVLRSHTNASKITNTRANTRAESSEIDIQQERFSRISQLQDTEEWIKKLKLFNNGVFADLSKIEVKKCAKLSEIFVILDNNVLYYKPYSKNNDEIQLRIVVPIGLQKDILSAYHDELGAGCHQGISKTYSKIKKYYYWKGLYADVERYIVNCLDCQSGRGKPKYMGISPGNITATRPFQIVAMDFAIALPKTYSGNVALLLFCCLFTGFIILVPMAETTAEDVANVYLEYVYKRFGAQETIRHDRDPRFMSRVFKAFNRMMKQKQNPTLAYRPQANGQQERSVQTVMNAIKLYIEDVEQKDWDQYVPRLELALNNTENLDYKLSSFYLVHGWDARTTLDAMIPPIDKSASEITAWKWRNKVNRLQQFAIKHANEIQTKLQKQRADNHNNVVISKLKKHSVVEYKEGDQVWIFFNLVKPGVIKKLAHMWHGPYRIAEKLNDFTYRICLLNTKARFFSLIHVSRLKPYYNQQIRPVEVIPHSEEMEKFDEALLPEDSWEVNNNEEEYEVEKILDDKIIRNTRYGKPIKHYLVKWMNYDESTWVAENDLSCGALIYEYDKEKKQRIRFVNAQTADEEEILH